MARENIVAVGLLTQRDLDVLGQGFSRKYRIADDDMFDDLLRQLDRIEATVHPGKPATSDDVKR